MLPDFCFKDPYNGWILNGPYLNRTKNRNFIELRNGKILIRMNYAKFLMETKLGRRLNSNELVHHKDENQLNDSIDNLELLTKGEHNKLHARGITYLIYVCAYCKKEFKRQKLGKYVPIYCSRRCSALERYK